MDGPCGCRVFSEDEENPHSFSFHLFFINFGFRSLLYLVDEMNDTAILREGGVATSMLAI